MGSSHKRTPSKYDSEAHMRVMLIIACMLLAGSCYADETKDAATEQTPQKQYASSPDWANPDAPPKFNDRDETEPSYSDTDEPSFQPEPR